MPSRYAGGTPANRAQPLVLALGLAAAAGIGVLVRRRVARADGHMLQIGDEAPDFTLKNQDGNDVTLSSYRGKKAVVVYFYPADQTMGCTAQACAFRDAYDDLQSSDAEVIGISKQDVESKRLFAGAHHLPFSVCADPGNKVLKLYAVPRDFFGLISGRVTYIVDKQGKLAAIYRNSIFMGAHPAEAKKVLMTLNGGS